MHNLVAFQGLLGLHKPTSQDLIVGVVILIGLAVLAVRKVRRG